MSTIQTVLAFLVALTVLIFVHEMGHFLVARWCGVKVLRFSIGFGHPLLVRRWGPDQTEWVLAAIPLGGYVRMLDERDPDVGQSIASNELHRAFSRRPLYQRALIVAAGPIANFLLAILLYAVLAWQGSEQPVPRVDEPPAQSAAARAGLRFGDRILDVDGRALDSWNQLRLLMVDAALERRDIALSVERDGARLALRLQPDGLPDGMAESDPLSALGLMLAPGQVLIGSLVAGEAAERAGLLAGDQVLAVDGQPIRRARELIERVRSSPGRPLMLAVQRGADEITIKVTPVSQSAGDGSQAATRGRIGAVLQDRVRTEFVRFGPVEGLVEGVSRTWEMSEFSLRMIGRMLTGELSVRNLSGPVTIADLAGHTARRGVAEYLGFLALISISLGVLNLLPIPVLDGGHLVYYALEAIRRRPLSEGFMRLSQKAGMVLVVMLMAVALYNDFARLFGP